MITYMLCILCIFDMSLSHLPNETNIRNYNEGGIVPRIYNGWPAKLGDVPYQISFKGRYRRNRFTSFCGGVIIAPNKLLSAAHCFVPKPSMFQKICGSSGKVPRKMLLDKFAVAGQLTNRARYPYGDSPEDGQWRPLRRVRYPREYSFPKLDFAIVFLLYPFRYDNYVNEIPYASKFVDYSGKCLASGFGRTSPSTRSDKLLLVHLTLITTRMCNRMHRKKMRHFVCTSSQLTDVGKGDSGGPLVCMNTGDPRETSRGILVGIVSGHSYGVGSFFTRVSSFYSYVQRNKSRTEYKNYTHLIFAINLIHWRFLLF